MVRVRADLGYPIMVTPLSQFVGSQAAINVIVGERYAEVTDQIIQYALGLWGREGADTMDPDVKHKILDRPRGKEMARWVPPDLTIEEVRRKLGGPGVTDEELLLRWMLSEEEIAAMRAAGPPTEYLNARLPMVALMERLTDRSRYAGIRVRRPGLSLSLQKSGA